MEKITSLDPPKKSLTAYTLFVKVKRQELLAENPDAKTPDIMKEIGRLWGNLPKDAKDIYKEIADQDKERYQRQLEQINKLKKDHMEKDENLEKPKKCLSAYMIFVRETRQKVTQEHPEMKVLDVMKEVGRRWQSIDPIEKASFEHKSQLDKQRFNEEHKLYTKRLQEMQMRIYNKVQSGEIKMPEPPSPQHKHLRPHQQQKNPLQNSQPKDEYLPPDTFSQSLAKPI